MNRIDVVVVGAGLTGSTIARLLADAGRRVLIVDRRPHHGGNVHDSTHPCGIRVHTYGPHFFRCSSPRIWEYAQRFGSFYPYEARVKTQVHGRLENWPIDEDTIQRYGGPVHNLTADAGNSFEEVCLRRMPAQVYRDFIKGYTETQWGCPANQLDASLATRIHINHRGEARLTPDKRFQGLPCDGYTAWMQRMIAGIEVWLAFDYLKNRDLIPAHDFIVFTGPIDEFFGYDLGRLAYRTQQRRIEFFARETTLQPCAQINYGAGRADGAIRTIEWKHLASDPAILQRKGTVITTETPTDARTSDASEYPFPDAKNKTLYERYRARADLIPNTIFCGRLGEYRYIDMDQAIGRAMVIAQRLLSAPKAVPSPDCVACPAG